MPSFTWTMAAGLGLGLVILLPWFNRRHLRDPWDVDPPPWYALVWTIIQIVIATGLLVVGAIKAYTPGEHLWWWLAAAAATIALVVYGCVVVIGDDDYHFVAVIVVALSLVVAMGMTSLKALDDNSYRVTRGIVIGQNFTPAYFTPLVCTGNPVVCTGNVYVPDDWALTLRDCETYERCVEGTLHFASNVFGQYPVGSHYPNS